jgi:hypothetical protein
MDKEELALMKSLIIAGLRIIILKIMRMKNNRVADLN